MFTTQFNDHGHTSIFAVSIFILHFVLLLPRKSIFVKETSHAICYIRIETISLTHSSDSSVMP